MKTAIFTSALAGLAYAFPTVEKRQASGSLSANDVTVLQLALYLEHLETSLYSGGYANFTDAQYEADGLSAVFRKNINVTAEQEITHASTIASTLMANGVTPVPACTYSFPYTSPKTFAATADLITSTGLGAYLGAADLIMDNPGLLTIAASILTTEARHDAYLRSGLGQSPFAAAFDTPLTADYAYNLAQAFIVHCPQQLTAFPILPTLAIAAPQAPASINDPIAVNGTVTYTWTTTSSPITASESLYIAYIAGPSEMPVYMPLTLASGSTTKGSAAVPAGIEGTYFAVLTATTGLNATTLTNTGTLAGPVVFAIDSSSEA